MTSLSTQLQHLQDGQSQKVRGVPVRREDDQYVIDGKSFTLVEAAKALVKKRKKFPYDQIAFLLVKPPGRVISFHQILNHTEHADLLEKAKQKKYVVYYADVVKRDGKFFAVQPWIVDFESVDNLYEPEEIKAKPKSIKPKRARSKPDVEEVEDTDEIRCPFCKKKCTSTSGLTLHIKARHST